MHTSFTLILCLSTMALVLGACAREPGSAGKTAPGGEASVPEGSSPVEAPGPGTGLAPGSGLAEGSVARGGTSQDAPAGPGSRSGTGDLPPGPPKKFLDPPIWRSVAQVEEACRRQLDAARARRKGLLSVKGGRTLPNTLVPYNDMLVEVDRVLPISELFANVATERAVRDAAEKCQQEAMKFLSALKLDRGLYEALAAVPVEGLDPGAARFLKHLLRDYRRAGVHKDEATRKELARLHEEMVKVEQDFSRNIREDKRFIELDNTKELAGLPADFIESHKPNESGKIRISTDYPDFFPFETYSVRADLRQELYQTFQRRAYPANQAVLEKLLDLRHRYATLLGYEDWAAYNAEDKMVKEKKVIADFLQRVSTIARPRMEQDLKALLARKKKDLPDAKAFLVSDRFYYVQKLRSERFGVDAQKLRAYFPFPKVKEGILSLVQELFGVVFEKVDAAVVWHEAVEAYDVLDGGERVARFYLDLHPRDGKYGHAAEFAMITGVLGRQLPSASLVCNFPDPKGDGPALMEHGDVTTFFHEFGHLMHQLLSGRQAWVTQSGINCEWDFVEAPSQLLEEWTWDPEILQRFARHHETGEVIPKELVLRMRQADELGKGVHVMRQMFYAMLSFTYHSRDPKGMDLLEVLKEVKRGYSPYPYTPETYPFANFGHLGGYSSMYYTYMWSLVLAKDLFTRFEEKGLLDRATAKTYRRTVIEPGGSVDAVDMVEAFLGRPYSFDAFEAWLQKGS